MLNKNLQKIRKERGLTQEALAVKLNVVRQTISKWEQGSAVPDADTLCRIAEALDIPVTELLGTPTPKEQNDTTAIVESLAEINEQLAIRNRRSHRIWKIAGILLLAAIISIILLSAASMVAYTKISTTSDDVDVVQVSENDIPLFHSILELDEHDMNEYLITIVSRKQLIETWGKPDESDGNKDYWKIDNHWKLIVEYDENDMVTMCGKEKCGYLN